MGVNRSANPAHAYHNAVLVHRMLAFWCQLRLWNDTSRNKDSGLSGHISSSFDQYLPHYGQNPQERNSGCINVLKRRSDKDVYSLDGESRKTCISINTCYLHVIVNNKEFKKKNQQSIKRMNWKTSYARMLFNFLFLRKYLKKQF